MNIGYNAYALNKPITGVGRYLQALSFMKSQFQKTALTPNSTFFWDSQFDDIISFELRSKLSKLIWNFFHPLFIREKFDIYHSPFPSLPYFLPKSCKKIITVHDVLFLTNPEWYPKIEVLLMRLSLYLSIIKADGIICVSKSTKNELIKYYPISIPKISVVYNPILQLKNDSNFSTNNNISNVLPLIKNGKYFVLPSNRHPRKNIVNTVEGFLNSNFYKNGYKLCLCGINEAIDKYILDKSIVELKYLSDYDYNILIKKSSGLFYFSLAEGFGYPIIEAIEAKIPIFCSKIPTSIEIIGDHSEFLCQDLSSNGITDYLNYFFNQPAEINNLLIHLQKLKEKFVYHKFEDSMIKIYKSLLKTV